MSDTIKPINNNRNTISTERNKQSHIQLIKGSIKRTAATIQFFVETSILNFFPAKGNIALRKFVNFAMKKPIENMDQANQTSIHNALDGQSVRAAIESNYRFAEEFLESLEGKHFDDLEGLKKIVEHRKSMLNLVKAPRWRRPKLYLKQLQALSENNSFSFPGGCIGHYVSYEVMKKNGNYFFIVHNRGAGRDPKLHGEFLANLDGKTYAKTSVSIKVSPELLNLTFFKRLELSSLFFNMAPSYEVIQKFLIDQGGEVQISAEEKAWKDSSPQKNNRAYDMIMKDPSVHTVQSFGTCSESNLTSPEKEMASPETLKALKLFTITKLTDEISKSRWISKATKDKIAAYSEKRANKLKKDL